MLHYDATTIMLHFTLHDIICYVTSQCNFNEFSIIKHYGIISFMLQHNVNICLVLRRAMAQHPNISPRLYNLLYTIYKMN